MLIAAFVLFALMLVSWMVAPDGDRTGKMTTDLSPVPEPAMVPAIS